MELVITLLLSYNAQNLLSEQVSVKRPVKTHSHHNGMYEPLLQRWKQRRSRISQGRNPTSQSRNILNLWFLQRGSCPRPTLPRLGISLLRKNQHIIFWWTLLALYFQIQPLRKCTRKSLPSHGWKLQQKPPLIPASPMKVAKSMLHNPESDSSLVTDVQKFLWALKLTKEHCDEIELATRGQDSGYNSPWKQQRAGRL